MQLMERGPAHTSREHTDSPQREDEELSLPDQSEPKTMASKTRTRARLAKVAYGSAKGKLAGVSKEDWLAAYTRKDWDQLKRYGLDDLAIRRLKQLQRAGGIKASDLTPSPEASIEAIL